MGEPGQRRLREEMGIGGVYHATRIVGPGARGAGATGAACRKIDQEPDDIRQNNARTPVRLRPTGERRRAGEDRIHGSRAVIIRVP